MMAGTIPKPQMRRLLERNLKIHLPIGVAVALVSGVAWKILVYDARKKKYADFYKTYDPEAKLKIMCDAGLMQSCGPNSV